MIEYLIAAGWGLLGWATRVAYDFYSYSKKIESTPRGRFVKSKFLKKYDQDWVLGFFATLMLAAISKLAWDGLISKWVFEVSTPYEARVNVLIGFLAVYLINKIVNKTNANN